MANFYLKLSKFFLYLVPFSVVIVSTSTLFPFIVGKYVFFRTAVGLALIFYLLALLKGESLITADKKFALWRQPLVIAVSIFVLIFLLAGFFGVDPSFSFWSNFERGEGGLQMLHFFVFFILLVLTFRDKKDWHRLFIVSILASGLMIAYGIGAALKLNGFIGPGFCGRLQGSLGNPAYVGTYLIFSLFYVGYLLVAEQQKVKKWLWLGLLIFFSFFLLLTQTRGAFMGLGVGLIAFSFYLAIASPPGWLKKTALVSGILLVLSAVLIIWFRPTNINLLPFCSSANRLLEISVYDSSSQPRLWTWGSAIRGWKERPILGWGPENFSAVFDKYFDTRHYTPNAHSETWFDRAHSIFLDYLSQTGILGLLSYLGIFAAFYWQLFKKTLINADKKLIYADKKSASISQNQHISAWQRALLFSLPIAYLVQGLVLFEVLPIYLNIFLFLAFSNFIFNQKS